jgi:hypothetical protein
MTVDELLVHLKPAVAESAAKFDLRVQWSGRTCKFSGAALGYLKVSETSLILAARLVGYVALLHKKMIETEITKTLDSVIR